MTALWMGVVLVKPRTRMPSISCESSPSVSNPTGRGSYSACFLIGAGAGATVGAPWWLR
jgi:hypothetical protein